MPAVSTQTRCLSRWAYVVFEPRRIRKSKTVRGRAVPASLLNCGQPRLETSRGYMSNSTMHSIIHYIKILTAPAVHTLRVVLFACSFILTAVRRDWARLLTASVVKFKRTKQHFRDMTVTVWNIFKIKSCLSAQPAADYFQLLLWYAKC